MAIAARQRHLVTLEQFLGCGFTPSGVRRRVQSQRLFRVHSGVFSLVPPPLDQRQCWLAAVLACGPGALLSDMPAAMLLGMAPEASITPQVSVPGDRGRSREGIVVHRRTIAIPDRSAKSGIPCTSAARALLDVAATSPVAELERMLIRADSLRILNRRHLDELIAENSGRRGIGQLRSLVAPDPTQVRSDVEAAVLQLCRSHGLPEPLVNHRIEVAGRTIEVDFCWPELGIVIEIDGYAFHGGRQRANSDRDRDQRLSLAGWTVHRFTADQVRLDPEGAIRRLAALLAIRRTG